MITSLLVELFLMAAIVLLPLWAAKRVVGFVTKDTFNTARLGLGLLIAVTALVWAGVCLYVSVGFLNDYKNAWMSANLVVVVLAIANGGLVLYLVLYCLAVIDIIHTLFRKLKESVTPG